MEAKKFLMLLKMKYYHKKKQGKGRKSILNRVASGRVAQLAKVSDRKHLKILTHKQMLQRLPIALVQVKAGNLTNNKMKLDKLYILCIEKKKLLKKAHNNIINSIKLKNRMDTIFMNSENSKTSDPYRQLLNLSDKINLKRSDKYVVLSNLSIYYSWKNIKKSYKNNKFKMSAPTWNEEFELPDGSYSVSSIQSYFKYILKNMKQLLIIFQ